VQVVPKPRAELFDFFADAHNLERITPEFLHFRVITPPPITMDQGTMIDYRLRLYGAPLRWRTEIELFEPARRFVDIQLKGPYRLWRHLHEFDDVDGGTRIRDFVEYEIPFGPIGRVARTLMVERTLERIFDFRSQAVDELFGSPPPET
jgi:ligand-binding SRPBCC domain-containing protein